MREKVNKELNPLIKCLDNEDFKSFTTGIQTIGEDQGFNEKEIDLLLNHILAVNVNEKTLANILQSLIPKQTVSKKTIDSLFALVLKFYHKENVDYKFLVTILNWIKALIVTEIIDVSLVKHHFFYYFSLLKFFELVSGIDESINNNIIAIKNVFVFLF